MARRVGGLRAGEQLVPAREAGGAALGVDREDGAAGAEGPRVGRLHERGGRRVEQQVALGVGCCGVDPAGQAGKIGVVDGALGDQGAAFLEFERERQAGRVLLGQLVAEGGETVDPGLDHKFVQAEPSEREFGGEAVVAERAHAAFLPGGRVAGAPQQRHADHLVAVGDDVGGDAERVAHLSLGGEAALLDDRGDGGDVDAAGRRIRQCGHGDGRADRRGRDQGEQAGGGGSEVDRVAGQQLGGVLQSVLAVGASQQAAGADAARADVLGVEQQDGAGGGGVDRAAKQGHDALTGRRDQPGGGQAGKLAVQRVGAAYGGRQIDQRIVHQAAEPGRVGAGRVEREGGAEFEAHGHQPAGAEAGGQGEGAASGVRRGGEARAEGQLGHGDQRGDGGHAGGVVVEPVGAEIPRPGRRGGEIEAAAGEAGRLGRAGAERPGEEVRRRRVPRAFSGAAGGGDQARPDRRRHVMRPHGTEAGDAEAAPGGEAGA